MYEEYYQLQLFLTEKQCVKCGKVKPVPDFPLVGGKCLNCRRAHLREYARQNPERAKERHRRWRENSENRERERAYKRQRAKENPEVWAKYCRKRYARKKNAPGDGATLSELIAIYGSLCYLCGKAEAVEVDHVVPLSKGGTNYPENLRPACMSCNRRKNNKLLEEYLKDA